jgi:ATP-dependent DNA ligase
MRTYQDKNSPLYEGLPFCEIRGDYIHYPCVAEIKADGEFQYLISQEGKVYLANKREHGRIRTEMPVTNIRLPDNSVFVAELIYGAGMDFYDFLRHKLSEDLNLTVFGCVRYEGEDIWKTHNYIEVRKILERQKFYNEKVKLAPKFLAQNKGQLLDFFDRVTKQGFEGVVIKDLLSQYANGETGRWVKWKYQTDADFVICGFQSGSKRAKTLSVLLGHRVDGKIQPLTYCGGGFSFEEKETLLRVLKEKITGNEGDEYYVDPKIVITVKYNGVIRDEKGSVHSLRHPRFKCFRFDKTPQEVNTIA